MCEQSIYCTDFARMFLLSNIRLQVSFDFIFKGVGDPPPSFCLVTRGRHFCHVGLRLFLCQMNRAELDSVS